jgi:chaperone modulatory protein CbpM
MKKAFLTGELLDESSLSLEAFASACRVEVKWVVERIEAGHLNNNFKKHEKTWCFKSEDIVRARRLLSIEQSFDADAELAALVADLIEEVNQLKQKLKVAQM